MSAYFNSLTPEAQDRYHQKISAINGYDPYTLQACDFNLNLDDLPEMHVMDIISYFVFRKSFFSEKQIKAFKSLDAYKYYEAGFVHPIKATKINDNYLVMSEVKHSQRMNDPKLKPWMILLPDSSIDSAHCTCMAGLGEACSHIAAIAFAIHLRVEKENELSVTDKLCLWKVPVVKNKINPMRIKEIDWGRKIKSYTKTQKLKKATSLSGQSLVSFLKKCEEAEPHAVIFNVMNPFAEKRVPKIYVDLPQPLTDLYDPKYETYSLEELRSINISFEIAEKELITVTKATLNQSKNSEWYKQRNGRITSSCFKRACTTSVDKPSRTLINCVCYGTKASFTIKPLTYGLESEKKARQSYYLYMREKHTNLTVKETGLIISKKSPIFGSSIDALVNCACCGTGCCEFKCPYRMHELNLNMKEFVSLKNCYIKEEPSGKLSLDRNHEYYYQVQLHMFCTETTYCDFVVWSKKYMYIERILRDDKFLESKLDKATVLHKNVFLPELLGKWYTKPKDSVQVVAWCECCSPENGEPMVKCCNEECQIQLFHVKCVMPELDALVDACNELEWFCNACSGRSLDSMDWEDAE